MLLVICCLCLPFLKLVYSLILELGRWNHSWHGFFSGLISSFVDWTSKISSIQHGFSQSRFFSLMCHTLLLILILNHLLNNLQIIFKLLLILSCHCQIIMNLKLLRIIYFLMVTQNWFFLDRVLIVFERFLERLKLSISFEFFIFGYHEVRWIYLLVLIRFGFILNARLNECLIWVFAAIKVLFKHNYRINRFLLLLDFVFNILYFCIHFFF